MPKEPKKLPFETEAHFRRRRDLAVAAQAVGEKKLWRVTAIEMKKVPDSQGGGYQMGGQDHFTVSAHCREMAIGAFVLSRGMNWFVVDAVEESVLDS